MKPRTISLSALTMRPPFSDLFHVDTKVLDSVTDNMRQRGYDDSEPILTWNVDGAIVVIDGHTRLQAAGLAGLDEVTISEQAFDSEFSALATALRRQTDRRNLTTDELRRVVRLVDEKYRQPKGGTGANQYTKSAEGSREPSAPSIRSAEIVAAMTNTSPSMVKRIRQIEADPTAQSEVDAGVSIYRAAQNIAERKRGEPRSNGYGDRMSRDENEPWFKARSAGKRSRMYVAQAQSEIEQEIVGLGNQGVSLADVLDDRRVSAEWNKALVQARALVAFLRTAMREASVVAD